MFKVNDVVYADGNRIVRWVVKEILTTKDKYGQDIRIAREDSGNSFGIHYFSERCELVNKPTYPEGTPITWNGDKTYKFRTGITTFGSDGCERVELIWTNAGSRGEVSCGFYDANNPRIKRTLPPLVEEGQRVQVQVTGTVEKVLDDGFSLDDGKGTSFYVPSSAVDGRPTVIKAEAKPWKMGEKVSSCNGGKVYHVQALLTNDWCVLLRDGTTADFKLAHKNDPAFTRVTVH